MIPNRCVGLSRLHLFIQMGVSLILFWTVFLVLHFFVYPGGMESPAHYSLASAVLVLSLLIEYSTRTEDEKSLSGLNTRRLRGVCHRQLVFAMATMFGFIVMSKDHTLSRIFLGSFFVLEFLWITWSNLYGFRSVSRNLFRSAARGRGRALLVGTGADINHYLSNSRAPIFPGLDLFGYVTIGSDSPSSAACALPELGNFQNIRDICGDSKAKALVLLGLQSRGDLVSPVIQLADDFGLRAMWIDNIDSRFGQRFHPYHTGKYSIVSHMNEPLEDPINRMSKRMLDLVGSVFGMIFVLPPAIVLVWIIQRLKSPGPLFYTQERTGRNGEKFKCYKFRSMYVNRLDEGVQTEKNDSRIFPGGDFIRKTSIDELPQLINVLLGDMSIVGPRPHAEFTDLEHADRTHLYRLRALAKPGITGLAQCKGYRGDTSEPSQIRNRVRMDLFYIQNWSLLFDIHIIVLTIVHLIKPSRTAY
ncbi:MAG: exopolysaccharide biosynthesis polyprenyl glycosylphosphotransferase [Verrucomicrobiales bacterium]|nr:exopolysaccharide biosynthesis polyprenyl glycosylphosphotransferase [Verrucomicrobiales bacterium]